jgi:hypothetical protein
MIAENGKLVELAYHLRPTKLFVIIVHKGIAAEVLIHILEVLKRWNGILRNQREFIRIQNPIVEVDDRWEFHWLEHCGILSLSEG